MKLGSLVASPPVFFFFFLLAIAVLILPCIVTPMWYRLSQHIKDEVDRNGDKFRSGLLSEIENTATLLPAMTSTATNVAKIIRSSLQNSDLLPSEIATKVAPLLFQAISVIPLISQVSYIGMEGSFFSYYKDSNQVFAMYSNSTVTPPELGKYTCYRQSVDPNTGKPIAEAVKLRSLTLNTSWIRQVLNSSDQGYASMGRGWNDAQDPVFLNSVSMDTHALISLGFPVKALTHFFNSSDLYGGKLFMATQTGQVLLEGDRNTRTTVTGDSVSYYSVNQTTGNLLGHIGTVPCIPSGGKPRTPLQLKIGNASYMVYCSPLKILGVHSVYALAIPHDGLESEVRSSRKAFMIMLLALITATVVSIFCFPGLMARASNREMELCNALTKQMEASEQAERKSTNKSLALASASHDIRAALAGIIGLIEISYEEVIPGSELETNLRQMESCSRDLLGILNSILDMSKIEAGKMQLEEEEFDLANLLEDVVDLYHPVAMKKGVDLVLDPRDGSILQFSHVKGDRGKLKQILSNLLSNAVKFTQEGHVTVRAWAQKPSLESKMIASNTNGWRKYVSSLLVKKEEEDNESETTSPLKQNPDAMEFVFEAADTGNGIPRDKWKSVFENFVQVKETALGQGGTGLGLGIVQSLVRLMGGEIGIVDKEDGERGTCFRFNVFLIKSTGPHSFDDAKGEVDVGEESMAQGTQHKYSGLTPVRTPSSCLKIRTTSPKTEGSHVVLMIQNKERLRSSQKFMESLGIRVSAVEHWEHLHSVLMKIKYKQSVNSRGSSGNLELGSRSDGNGAGTKDVPLSMMDGIEQGLPSPRSNALKGIAGFVVLVLDASAGPFQELHRTVTEFKRGLQTSCKVVWLDKPTARGINLKYFEEDMIDPDDDILLKPFHGSRLYEVIRLLPEFEGQRTKQARRTPARKVSGDAGLSSSANLSARKPGSKSKGPPSPKHTLHQEEITLAESSSRGRRYNTKRSLSPEPIHTSDHSPIGRRRSVRLSELQEEYGNPSSEKPLTGMKFLVAEDDFVLRKLAHETLLRLGATVKLCENGEEALELVRTGLHHQMELEDSFPLPYDFILMDCQMPKMNGLEATREIRKEEMLYGVHTPIIALTAHSSGDEAFAEAGMDFHLQKPLKREDLLDAIGRLQDK